MCELAFACVTVTTQGDTTKDVYASLVRTVATATGSSYQIRTAD